MSIYRESREVLDKAFVNNLTGPAVEVLRRGYVSLYIKGELRGTKEFEELIKLR